MTESTFTIISGKRAPLEARRGLEQLLDAYPPMTRFDAKLCLTELVTNVIEHAGIPSGAPIEVLVRGDDGAWLRLDVRYAGSGFVPGANQSRSGTEKGRGLALVDAVSDSWGTASDEGHVWVELRVGSWERDARKPASMGGARTRLSA